MTDVKEQRICIKFCYKLHKTAAETHRIQKEAFGDQALSQTRTYVRVPQPVTVLSRIQQCPFASGPERLPKDFSFLQFVMANGETDLIWTMTDRVYTNVH